MDFCGKIPHIIEMSEPMFDTLSLSEDLADGDAFTPKQASKLAHALSKAVYRDVATKTDIAEVKALISELQSRAHRIHRQF